MLYAEAVSDCMIIDGCTPVSDEQEVFDAYQRLIDSGVIWHLQGSRQRTAMDLVANGDCHLPTVDVRCRLPEGG